MAYYFVPPVLEVTGATLLARHIVIHTGDTDGHS